MSRIFQNFCPQVFRKKIIFLLFQELENQKTTFLDKIPEEPLASNPDCVCILFKMPNGERLERRFLSTHTLRVSKIGKLLFLSRVVSLTAKTSRSQNLKFFGGCSALRNRSIPGPVAQST